MEQLEAPDEASAAFMSPVMYCYGKDMLDENNRFSRL